MTTGTETFAASALTMARYISTVAYFSVEGVVWMMTGDFISTAAAMIAMTISMFSALKAPTA